MRIYIAFALLVGLSLSACQQDSKPATLTSANGYEYVNHTNLEGETPEPGSFAYFQAYMRNGDSVVYSTRTQEQTPFVQIPAEGAPRMGKPSPVEDVVAELAIGDSATVAINIDTLPRKPRGFENTSEILYDVVLVEVLDAAAHQERMAALQAKQQAKADETKAMLPQVEQTLNTTLEQYRNGELGDQLQETASGLKYVIHEEGTGEQAAAGKNVSVHYYGALAEDGSKFDTSYERGQPITFPLGQGQVIPGWDEGIALLKEGAKATLLIPSDLGYGAQGAPPRIPGGAELAFYVELVEVQ